MTFGTTPAGTITKEQTLLSTRRLPVAASTSIAKGDVCELDAGGDLIVSPTSQTAEVGHFVALQAIDNSAGSDGDLSCPLAVRGHFVTVVADGAIVAGERVVVSAATAGQVIAYVGATHEAHLIVGVYYGKEGGIISTSGTTPFLESYTDDADFLPADAADGDIIEVELF